MEKKWVKVYSSSLSHRAEIIKSVLEENNINAVIMNKKDSSYLFGVVEVYVEEENVTEAETIIKNNENE